MRSNQARSAATALGMSGSDRAERALQRLRAGSGGSPELTKHLDAALDLRARVARDSMDMTDINMQQDEQDALEQQALADFAAAEGIAVEDESAGPDVGESIIDPGSSDATKSMGPAQTE